MYGLLLALGLAAVASANPFYGYAPYGNWGGHWAGQRAAFNPYWGQGQRGGAQWQQGQGAQWGAGAGGFAGAQRFGCGVEPVKPANTRNCNWEAVQNAYGCVVDFECVPLAEAPPPPCPSAPARPDTGDHCNWIPIQDKRGCIIDYECEPVTPPPCPPAPVKPDNGGRCKWTPIKDHKDCLIDWECEPLGPARFFPLGGQAAYPALHGGLPWFKK